MVLGQIENLETEKNSAEKLALESKNALRKASKELASSELEIEKGRKLVKLADEARRTADAEAESAKYELRSLKKKLADLEAEVKACEEKAWGDGYDEAEKRYYEQVVNARSVFYKNGWKDALMKAGIPQDSPLYHEIPEFDTTLAPPAGV